MTQSSHEIQIARRIKSRAQIAQLVEQRTENPRVTGSIPVLGIFLCTTIINPTTTGKRKHALPFFPI